jgi:HEAT repeat protein
VRASDGTALEVNIADLVVDIDLDVAVIPLPTAWNSGFPPTTFARVNRAEAGRLENCEGIGFPQFARDEAGHRDTAEFHGIVYQTDEAQSGRLLMREPNVAPGTWPSATAQSRIGDVKPDESPWGGLSGALAFYNDHAIGVVVEHHPRQGENAIRMIGFEPIATKSPKISQLLALRPPAQLPQAAAEPSAPPLDDAELVPRYLKALAARFEERSGPTPHIALGLERGGRAPAAGPASLRQQHDKLRALLQPRLSPDPPERAPDEGQPVADLMEFQKRSTRLVLLGAPGAGKSTTLRHLVERLGAPWLSAAADDMTKIPIFADLSEWHDESMDLVSFLQAQLRSLGQPALAERLPDLMRQGRVVLLLDGLNEIPRLRRDTTTDHADDPRVDAVAELGRRAEWAAVGCVLSCRSKDFQGGPLWHDIHLLALDTDRVAELAEAFFHLHGLPDASAVTADFLRDLYRSASSRVAHLRSLITNPFFLVKALEYYSVVRRIPDRLTDLLSFSVAEVLERERVNDRADELRRQLSCLAFRMTVNGQFGPVDPARAAAWLAPDDRAPVDLATARSVWRAAEGASLIITSDAEVRFSHQLIQEFFAACSLAGLPLTAALIETVAEPQFNEIWSLWGELDPALADRLVPFLGDAAAGVRRAAAIVLGPLRDRRAADPLARVLADSDATVSWSAALSLASLADHRATPALIERLHAGESGVRQVAAATLGDLHDPRAVDPLVDALLHDESTEVRAAAATALGGSADERALRPLVEVLVGSRDDEVSQAAARALGRLGDPRAVPDLLAQLGDSRIQYGAVDGLLAMGEAALDPLIDLLLHDRNATRRKNAAFALGLSHRPRAVPALIAALTDDEEEVQQESASALAHFGEPALAALIEVLDDGDEDGQKWALYALGAMADPRAVPHLLTALQSDSEQIAEQAASSLQRCGDGAVEPLVDILLDHVDPQTRWHAAGALGSLGEPGVAALVTAAHSDNSDVRVFAVGGLGAAADRQVTFDRVDPRVVETLAEMLYDTDRLVRRIAALALGGAGDARAVPSLARMIGSDEPDLRAPAAEQLGHVEDPSAVDVLVTALRDTDAETRRAACEALRRLLVRPRSVGDVVDAALAESPSSPGGDTGPRTALIELLSTWRDPRAMPALVRALRRAMAPLIAALLDADSEVASAAVTALERAVEPLIEVSWLLPGGRRGRAEGDADGEPAELRALVRETLVPLAHPEAVSALVAVLGQLDDEADDGGQPLRASVASLLGSVGDAQVVPALADLLDSPQNEVVGAAADALARIGGSGALSALVGALSSRTRQPRWHPEKFTLMRNVLQLADDRTAGLLLDALRDPAPHADETLVELLQALGELALVPLVTALGDPDPDIARAAARALDPAGDERVAVYREFRWRTATDALDRLSDTDVESILAASRREDEQVSRVAVALLEKLGHPAARSAEAASSTEPPQQPPPSLDELLSWLASDDSETRAEAARALGSRGDRQAVGRLAALLTDDAMEVRSAAAFALGQLGDRSVVEQLGLLLADPSGPVVLDAVSALGMLGGGEALRLILDALDTDWPRGLAAGALNDFDEQTYQEVGVAPVVDAVLTSVRREQRFKHNSDDYAVYYAALDLLPKLGAPARTLLLTALDDRHDAVRHLAAKVLAAGADLRAVPLLAWMAEYDQGDYVSGSGGDKLRDVARSAIADIQAAHRAREPLIEAMASEDRLTRYGAAFQLAHLEWRGATVTLIAGLQDSDPRIRWGAARWLGALHDERGIEPLVASLGDPNGFVRDNVTRSLVRFGPVVTPSVVASLDVPNPDVPNPDARAQAAVVLGYCGGADEVDRVAAALGDPAVIVCKAAADALSRLVDRGMTEDVVTGEIAAALSTAFRTVEQKDTGDVAQMPIIDALAKFDEARAVDLLIDALGSRHRYVRLRAVQRLSETADPRVIAPLNRALSDEESLVREDTASSLKKFADVSSVEPLIALLSRSSSNLERRLAIAALVAIGDSRAAAPLVYLLDNEGGDLRAEAADAIVTLADEAAIELLVARLAEKPPERYGYTDDSTKEPPALDVLVRIGARAAGAVIDALADSTTDRELYDWATKALRRIGAEAIPALIDGLGLPEESTRAKRCALSLAELGEPGRSALVTALADGRAEVRAGAAYGLWHTKDDEAIPPLVDALHDVDADVRKVAALALGSFDQAWLIEPLAAALSDPEERVRVCAAASLAQLGDDRGAKILQRGERRRRRGILRWRGDR